jgi:superfamily II DNA or RNA helicase
MNDLFSIAVGEIALRPYQLDAVERVRELIRQGKKNIILCAPTGSGKTVVGSYLINESQRKMRRSCFVVDRVTLINQTSETFDRYGVDHGVVQADNPRYRPWKRVQVCSSQTLARRKWPDADLIIVDEAHTLSKVVADRIKPRDVVTIGLTATPFTKGLGKNYDALVNVTTTNRLIADGFLSDYRIYSAVEPNMEGVRIVAGEWEEAETSRRALQVVGDVVAEYEKHGEGRKFIACSVDVAHAEELARQFNAAGIRVETYTYKTSDQQREEIVREFRKDNSYIRGLISPVALTKGFDVPDVSCIIMARPLRNSLAEHIQFFGRGLRIHPGKVDCVVLDHSGNCKRFEHEWTEFFETGALELDDGKPKPKSKKKDREAPALIKCPQCTRLHPAGPRCPACGHEYPRKVTVGHVEGTLEEWIASGNRKKLDQDIWPQICTYVRRKPIDEDRQRKMAQAIMIQITGQFARANFSDTKGTRLTPAVLERIQAQEKAYQKARRETAKAMQKAQQPAASVEAGDPPW